MPPLAQEILDSQDYKDSVASAVTEATSPLQTSLDNVQANNRNLVTEKQAEVDRRKADLEKYKNVDLEAYQAMQARLAEVDNDETRALMAKGEYDKVFEKQVATMNAEHGTQIEAANSQVEAANKLAADSDARANALEETLVMKVRSEGVSGAFASTDANIDQLTSVQILAQGTVMVKGERLPIVDVNNAGESVFRDANTGEMLQNATNNFGFKDWLVHLSEEKKMPLYAKPNGHGNPNAISDSNPKGLVRSKMTDDQVDAYEKEFGTEAYLNLPLN